MISVLRADFDHFFRRGHAVEWWLLLVLINGFQDGDFTFDLGESFSVECHVAFRVWALLGAHYEDVEVLHRVRQWPWGTIVLVLSELFSGIRRQCRVQGVAVWRWLHQHFPQNHTILQQLEHIGVDTGTPFQ